MRLKEEDNEDERKGKDTSGSGHHELLTHIQKLDAESKDSEQKMMELRHENKTMQKNLIASWEEEGRSRQLVASLREELLSVLLLQVRRRVGWRLKTDHLERYKLHVLNPPYLSHPLLIYTYLRSSFFTAHEP